MIITLENIEELIACTEDEHLEFKVAREQYDFNDILEYCIAFANEGGGKLILGVTNERPRRIVGSNAFLSISKTQQDIFDHLKLLVHIEEFIHPQGRIVIFNIPSRPVGVPLEYRGKYLMRLGERKIPMPQTRLKQIFAESVPDFSAEVCPEAIFDDLSLDAIRIFRSMWASKTSNSDYLSHDEKRILEEAELMTETHVTYAALILFGTKKSLGKYLSHAEIVFEYRNHDANIPYNQRDEFREGFFLYFEKLWEIINRRNDNFHYQDGLFQKSILTFNEDVVREATLNAVSHRSYQNSGSIFIKQFPSKLQIVSPGGFPEGITPENIIWRQNPRNRRLADAFQKCGLVERSGQGLQRIYRAMIEESKSLPDYSRSDEFEVNLCLSCQVQDVRFLKFIERVASETQAKFSVEDLLILDLINRNMNIPEHLKSQIPNLLDNSIVERISHGRGTRYILSRRFYTYLKKPGIYTRKKGLNKEENKALLEKHVKTCPGCKLSDLQEVLSQQKLVSIRHLLYELKKEGKVRVVGKTSAGRWFPAEY
jgi:ATP-dependent DNA helicase RecG